jgi:post-segregation antitoxin (ccd killing protein)
MKIKIRPRLDALLIAEARALGLDISRIVEEALIRKIEAERVRRLENRAEDRAGEGASG